MGTRGNYYSEVYTKGSHEHWTQVLKDVREGAAEQNKSNSEIRKELAAYIKDLDSQIGSAQTSLERLDTTHFDAHMRAATDSEKRRLGRIRASGRVSNELSTLQEKIRATAASAIANAEGDILVVQAIEEFNKAQDPNAAALALQTIAQKSGVLSKLGAENIEFGGGVLPTTAEGLARRQAIAMGLRDGLRVGATQFGANINDESLSLASSHAARLMTGVVPSDKNYKRNLNQATANIVASASRSAGGLTPESIDQMLVESGLASDIMTRTAEVQALQQERQRVAGEQARVSPDMTESDILAEAASRRGDVGLSSEMGPGIIGSFRREKQALKNLEATRAEAEKNQALRDTVAGLSVEQRVFAQAMSRASSAFDRDPSKFTGASAEVQKLADELTNALSQDKSLQGDQTRLVEMALQLASQLNPKASPAKIQRTRDEILQAFGHKFYVREKERGLSALAEKQPDAPEVGDKVIQAAEDMGEINPALSAYLQTFERDEAREIMGGITPEKSVDELIGAKPTDKQALHGPLLPGGGMYQPPEDQPRTYTGIEDRPALQAFLNGMDPEEAAIIRQQLLGEQPAPPAPAPSPVAQAPAPAPVVAPPAGLGPQSVAQEQSLAAAWAALPTEVQVMISQNQGGYEKWAATQSALIQQTGI